MTGWLVDGAARLQTLHDFGIVDSPPDPGFDAIVAEAAALCRAPVALISLLEHDRQWFKAKLGTELDETPIELAICTHALAHGSLLVIPDLTADPRTATNLLVTQAPHVRFYAGVPLVARGQALGTLCVLDVAARPDGLGPEQRAGLSALADRVVAMIVGGPGT